MENNDTFSQIDSKYISIIDFNDFKLDQNTTLGILHLNIASLNKYCDDLSNFLSFFNSEI